MGGGLHAGERGERDNHHVPVLGRRLCQELLPSVPGGAARSGQYVGGRVPLGCFASDLVDKVVGDHNPWLANQPEALELHRAHQHGAGFSGADDVVEKDGRLIDDAFDRVALIGVGREGGAQAGEASVGAVIGGGDCGVEAPVVFGQQSLAPVGVSV